MLRHLLRTPRSGLSHLIVLPGTRCAEQRQRCAAVRLSSHMRLQTYRKLPELSGADAEDESGGTGF